MARYFSLIHIKLIVHEYVVILGYAKIFINIKLRVNYNKLFAYLLKLFSSLPLIPDFLCKIELHAPIKTGYLSFYSTSFSKYFIF